MPAQVSTRGFTLVEMLVALAVMALLALMSWRGLDAMLRARQNILANHVALQGLQGGLVQWQMDLDALVETPYVNAVEWNGRVLRVLRHSAAGSPEALQVVAWTLGPGDEQGAFSWLRWQSPPLRSRSDLLTTWAEAAAWGTSAQALPAAVLGSEPAGNSAATQAQTVTLAPVLDWKLAYYRGGQWVAADSLMRTGSAGAGVADLPQGLRLELTLGPAGPLQGLLRSDWFNPLLASAR